jgi:hypothetical protein
MACYFVFKWIPIKCAFSIWLKWWQHKDPKLRMTMKYLWICLLWLTTGTVYSQIDQGDWLIGGQGTLRLERFDREPRLNVRGEITPTTCYFLTRRIALGGGIGLSFVTSVPFPSFGVSLSSISRIYLHGKTPEWYPFVEGNGGVGLGWTRFPSTPDLTRRLNASLGAAVGTSRFLRPGILLELALSGRRLYQSDGTSSQLTAFLFEWNARVGLQFLLDRSE